MVNKTQIALIVPSILIGIALLGQPSPPSAPVGCSGGVTILVNGTLPVNPVSGCVINLVTTSNIMPGAVPNPTLNGTDISFTPSTVTLATLLQVKSNPYFCNSRQGNKAYVCNTTSVGPGITGYSLGMIFLLDVDTTCDTSCTVQVDPNTNPSNSISIKQADGTTDPGGTLIANQAKLVWYDGTVMRLMF